MQNLLEEIIKQKNITTVFQPIFNVERKHIVGYEALTRGPENSELHSPEVLFSLATEYGLVSELEILCRDNAIKQFAELRLDGKLFLNVSSMILLDPDHPQGKTVKMVEDSGLSCEQIVIEISEKYPIPSNDLLYQALNKYRQFGFEVAIDDLGAGYSGLKQWSVLRPDIVKIDRYFVADCHRDIIKKEFLRTIFELGRSTNAQVIAEGIETQEEFNLLSELGLVYAQGYLLAKPSKVPSVVYPNIANIELNKPHLKSLATVGTLAVSVQTVSYQESANDVYNTFIEQPKLQCLPVLQNAKPIGIIYREQLMEFFSDIYGRALLAKRSITEVMDDSPLIVEHTCLLDEASIHITQLSDAEFGRYFIVAKQGYYLGLVSIRELLRQITEAKIENARYANPLTLLPGNVPIDKEIDYLLNANSSFHLAYLDLNHFKPFNDVYGYAKGDLMLKHLAQIICDVCQQSECFVGHIGGDDFVILFTRDDHVELCEQILNEYHEQSLSFFHEEHLEAEGYHAFSRNGDKKFFPLVSLAIGVISPDVNRCFSPLEISAMAADAKTEAKKLDGKSIFVCRRKTHKTANDWLLEDTA